jgi:hypothetical protein
MNPAWLKKYLALEIYGAVILAVLAGVGFKLFTAIRQYRHEKNTLQAVVDRKLQLDRLVPYPSAANVRQETENYQDILDGYNELNEQLRANQIEPREMAPAIFMGLMENEQRLLRKQLTDARVIYPQNCTFSFERYAGGRLPAKEHVPRLVQQWKIIEELCRALGQIGVAELVSINREEFEGAPETRPAPPGPARPENAGPLYTTQHFKLTVKAGEPAARDLLNLLARFPVFTVITSLEIRSPDPLRRVETTPVKEPPAPRKTDPRERPFIIGKELVELKLELDVYCFAPSLDFREKAKSK